MADVILVGDKPLLSKAFFVETGTNATATFRNGDTQVVPGTLTDPTTVTLTIYKPDGSSTSYTYAGATVTKYATGVFDKQDYTADQAGEYVGIWVGTGAAVDTDVFRFTAFATTDNLYCSIESLKSRFGISDTVDDFELQGAVRSASRRIESYCGFPSGRGFWRDAAVTVRKFVADSPACVRIPEGISTATGLIVKTDENADNTFERTLTVDTDFVLEPFNAIADGRPYKRIVLADNYTFPVHRYRAGVEVTARFGWPAVPDDVREACLILSHRLFKRKETSTGVVGFDALGATVRLSRTDPDVAELLAPYVVYGVA